MFHILFIFKLQFGKCQGTSVISPVIPLLAVVLSAFIISQKSVDRVFETHPSLYIITFGMVAAKVTNKLVVSNSSASLLHRHYSASIFFYHSNQQNFIFGFYRFRLHIWQKVKWDTRTTVTLVHCYCFWINISIISCQKFMCYTSHWFGAHMIF